ncbi:unnamed protein product [Cladocopium goreaui]|uniref:UDP-glucosyltransferase YojK n=1 Tax=Cladocopium goreaui TaxID=2562237 RepID=A0A9P1G8B7_9DINO|nr:unnamed protein product [Cladocopium goreaui]
MFDYGDISGPELVCSGCGFRQSFDPEKPLSSVATIYERAGILCGGAGETALVEHHRGGGKLTWATPVTYVRLQIPFWMFLGGYTLPQWTCGSVGFQREVDFEMEDEVTEHPEIDQECPSGETQLDGVADIQQLRPRQVAVLDAAVAFGRRGAQRVLSLQGNSVLATAATAGRSPTVAIFNVAMIGHVNPAFALVQELVRRGCRVHYFLPAVEQICSAAKESGAEVESYLPDMPDLVLEHCGIEAILTCRVKEPHEEILPDEQALWERAVWPLASTLLCGEYLIQRCRALGVSVVLYDPMTPHGLLVAQKLNLPKASLVTYPGMGSLADLMKIGCCGLQRSGRPTDARSMKSLESTWKWSYSREGNTSPP